MKKRFYEINQGRGFLSLPEIDKNINRIICDGIQNKLKNLFYTNNIDYSPDKCSSEYDAYKYISNDNWVNLFNKNSRTLNKKFALQISDYFSGYLGELLDSKIEITDDLLIGFPSICFRIVRPLHKNDIGTLHADQWFIDIGVQKERIPKIKSQLMKFWMPINVDSETSNLLLVPGSHKKNKKYKYRIEQTKNGYKPIINETIPEDEIFMIKNKNGFPVVFNMNLIHGGAVNKSKECRVSIEFEFFASLDIL